MSINIKRSTFFKITRALLNDKNVSRHNIASSLLLSEMTVGKVASLLIDAGILTEAKAPHSKGRHAFLLSPNKDINYTIVHINSSIISATLLNSFGEQISSLSEAVNMSMSPEENINLFLRHMQNEFDTYNSIVATGFDCHENTDNINRFEKTILSCSKDSKCFSSFDIITNRVSREYSEKSVLYIFLSGTASCLLISNGKPFPFENNAPFKQLPEQISYHKIAENVSSIIGGISKYSHIDNVIIESDTLCTSNEFIEHIEKTLLTKEFLSHKEIPEFVYFPNMSFTNHEIYKMLVDNYADKITRLIYDNSK